jgi:hypothetical protein
MEKFLKNIFRCIIGLPRQNTFKIIFQTLVKDLVKSKFSDFYRNFSEQRICVCRIEPWRLLSYIWVIILIPI